MPNPSVLHLIRNDWRVEVAAVQWAGMIAFLASAGWQPTVPALVGEDREVVIDDEHAKHFAAAGQIVLEETLKDPASENATIQFDMGKFAEIVTFAADGGFTIRSVKG